MKIKSYNEELFYNGTLRIPQNIPDLNILVAGDWGIISQ